MKWPQPFARLNTPYEQECGSTPAPCKVSDEAGGGGYCARRQEDGEADEHFAAVAVMPCTRPKPGSPHREKITTSIKMRSHGYAPGRNKNPQHDLGQNCHNNELSFGPPRPLRCRMVIARSTASVATRKRTLPTSQMGR